MSQKADGVRLPMLAVLMVRPSRVVRTTGEFSKSRPVRSGDCEPIAV